MNNYEEYLNRKSEQGPITGQSAHSCLVDLFNNEYKKGLSPDADLYAYLASRLVDSKIVFEFLASRIDANTTGRQIGYLSYFLTLYQMESRKVDVDLLETLYLHTARVAPVRHMCPDGPVAAICCGFVLSGDIRLKRVVAACKKYSGVLVAEIAKDSYDEAVRLLDES